MSSEFEKLERHFEILGTKIYDRAEPYRDIKPTIYNTLTILSELAYSIADTLEAIDNDTGIDE